MQVFRLMEPGVVDKVIAFDSLPERLVEEIELSPPSGMGRDWRTFLGSRKLVRKISAWRDHANRLIQPPDIVEEGPYFFVLEYKTLNRDKSKWEEITNFVRKAVDLSVRLMDKIEDMAIPMAVDAMSEVSPDLLDDVEKRGIIQIPAHLQEKEGLILPPAVQNVSRETIHVPTFGVQEEQPAQIVEEPVEEAKKEPLPDHIKTCTSKGRGGNYNDKCPRCMIQMEKRMVEA